MGSLTDALVNKTQIGVDTAPFIYYFERNQNFFSLAEEVVLYAEQEQSVNLYTSALTLLETTVYPLREGREDLVQQYHTALLYADYIQTIPLNISVIIKAAELRATYSLRTPDALQMAACILRKCDLFITNDRKLKRVSEIDVLVLKDFLPSVNGSSQDA